MRIAALLQMVFPAYAYPRVKLFVTGSGAARIEKERIRNVYLLLAVAAPISQTGTHAYVAATYPVPVNDPT